MNRYLILLVFAFLGSGLTSATVANPFDWSAFDELLKTGVREGTVEGVRTNLVNYEAFSASEGFLDIAEQLKVYDPSGLGRDEKLAFYINAYNYFAIKMVLDHWPVESIKDAGSLFSSVWKKEIGEINHYPVSLGFIEHEILRKAAEPRIHFAIVCASLSCPNLRREVYVAGRLHQQLEEQVTEFLGNPTKGVRIDDGDWEVSRIFDWFEEDFAEVGHADGAFTKGVEEYISRYLGIAGATDIGYLDYNWALNRQ